MSLLKQTIAQRRASEPAGQTCVQIGAQTPGVVLWLWPDEYWVFPWTYLVSARCARHEDIAQLVLSFTTQVVTAAGENLAPVIDAVAGFRLGLLRELPAAYRSRLSATAPFVSRIEVRPADAASPGPANVLKNPSNIQKPRPDFTHQ